MTVAGHVLGEEFRLSSSGSQGVVRVSALPDGKFVATYFASGGLALQVFSATGLKVGSELIVNSEMLDSANGADVTGLASGGYAVAWSTYDSDLERFTIRAQIIGADGVKVGSEFQAENPLGDHITGLPTIKGLANGNFVISWTDNVYPPISYAQIFAPDGTRVGAEARITGIQDGLGGMSVSAFADGGFIAVWVSSLNGRQDVKGQIYDAAGQKMGGEFLVNLSDNTYNEAPDVAVLADGSFVVTWKRLSYHYDSRGFLVNDGDGVTAQVFDRQGAKVGSPILDR
jgi:hypothetical protein